MKIRLVTFIIYMASKILSNTLKLRIIGAERVTELQKNGKGAILVSWHGRSFVGITLFRNRGYWAFISTSRDGEYQNRIFKQFGWNTVRGSSSARGAVRSSLSMCKHLRDGAILAHTPDGPRGPRGTVHPGAIFLSQKSGCPIIPVGASAWPRKMLPTWDRYMVPMPFSRTTLIYGEPIHIPPIIESEEKWQEWAKCISEAIDSVERRAEADVCPGMHTSSEHKDASSWRRA